MKDATDFSKVKLLNNVCLIMSPSLKRSGYCGGIVGINGAKIRPFN